MGVAALLGTVSTVDHSSYVQTSPSTLAPRRTKEVEDNNLQKIPKDPMIQDAYQKIKCQIDEYHGIDPRANGSERPVVLRGIWEPPKPEWKTEEGFLKEEGSQPYFVKGEKTRAGSIR